MRKKCNLIAVLFLAVLVYALGIPVSGAGTSEITELRQEGADFVSLLWTEDPDADGYLVYRSEAGGSFRIVKQSQQCSTINYGLKNGGSYSYRIRPFAYLVDGSRTYGPMSAPVSIQVGVKTPQDLRAVPWGRNSMRLRWTGDPLADSYSIYRSSDGTNWQYVKRVTEPSAVTYGFSQGETCYFRVCAVRSINGKTRYSAFSSAEKAYFGIEAPGELRVSRFGKDSLRLEWTPVAEAEGYRLYRSENGGVFHLIKTVTGTRTENYRLEPETTYTYRVAAVAERNSVLFKSRCTQSEAIRPALGAASALRVERCFPDGVELSWDAVEGATGYRLYRTDESGSRSLVKTVRDPRTSTFGLEAGRCWGFSVKPICETERTVLNGACSEVCVVFLTLPVSVTVGQNAVNRLHLEWTPVAEAEEYVVQIRSETGNRSELRTDQCMLEYPVTGPEPLQISVAASRHGVLSAEAMGKAAPIYEDKLCFSDAERVENGQILLRWPAAAAAKNYEIQRLDEKNNAFQTVSETAELFFSDVSAMGESQYRYRVIYRSGDSKFPGNWSEPVRIPAAAVPEYRAFIVGESRYETILNGPENDAEAVSDMLSGLTSMNWQTTVVTNVTKEALHRALCNSFAGAAEDDVSLFYFSGHGVTGMDTEHSGALVTVDGQLFLLRELAEILSGVPGKVIVVLDSCGSGAAVSGADVQPAPAGQSGAPFDPAEFNRLAISAFSAGGDSLRPAAGELAAPKFHVMTSSAYEQNSASVKIDGIWGGAFTRAFVGGQGYDFNTRRWSTAVPADRNRDGGISLQESYLYCRQEITAQQDIQAWPRNSSAILFYR